MSRVLVIDYGVGNIDSIRRALEECGASVLVGREPHDFDVCTHAVLPGVGAFGAAMDVLEDYDLPNMIESRLVKTGIPVLGICLGMQLLAAVGYEGGERAGLGLIPASVEKLDTSQTQERLPHIGWNEVMHDGRSPFLADIASGTDFYFVHSYAMKCDDPQDVVGTSPYCGEFVSVVNRGSVWGTQFHPEKSQVAGQLIFRNFLET